MLDEIVVAATANRIEILPSFDSVAWSVEFSGNVVRRLSIIDFQAGTSEDLDEAMIPRFEALGYSCRVYDNPIPGCGSVLLATRIEDASLPTILCYGHGDVVLGMEGRWQNGRDPWRLSFEGDRVYGRGVADNKGQHLVHIAAIEAVLKTRGKLGFNHKFLIEMGEENGSKGLKEVVARNKADFAADAFFASDGPRTELSRPNITLGNRGCCRPRAS